MSDQKTPNVNEEVRNATADQAELPDESLETVAGGSTNCYPDDPIQPDVFKVEPTPIIKPLL